MGAISYVNAIIYTSGKMTHALFTCSGSEAMEATIKLSRQYFLELNPAQPQRQIFISRKQSYHGATLAALAVSGHIARRAHYEPFMLPNMRKISPCNAYRYQGKEEGNEEYVGRLAKELEDEVLRAGKDKVCAFVAETVGAATGCMPPVPGYFKAMREVCDKYGVLLVLDEIMCGMGRCGTMHAWQQEEVVPDIQTLGKGLGGGYQPIAAILLNGKVYGALKRGSGSFSHGQTYQSHVLACSAALEVQRIIRADNLVARCKTMGEYLSNQLFLKLGHHPNVGSIRGRGLFWGIEFVKNRSTKEPFELSKGVAAVQLLALEKGVAVYLGGRTADGVRGDHILLAPPYTVSEEEIDELLGIRFKRSSVPLGKCGMLSS